MEPRYSNTNNTAPVQSAMKNKRLPVPHSFFDLTRNIAFDAPIGVCVPFDLRELLPDSDYEISYDILALTKNPLVRRMLSGMNVYIHTYAIDYKDVWEGFPTFVTRGRSGRITRTVPVSTTVIKRKPLDDESTDYYATHQFSPSSFMHLPCAKRDATLSVADDDMLHPTLLDSNSDTLNITFNALPLAFYQMICIHNYLPSNLLQDNTNFFPDDELHLRFSASIDGTSGPVYALSYDDDTALCTSVTDFKPLMDDVTIADSDTPVLLDVLRPRQFNGDRFNTGMPWPELVRGDIPSISLTDFTGSLDLAYEDGRLVKNVGILYEGSETANYSGSSAYYVSPGTSSSDGKASGVYNLLSYDASSGGRSLTMGSSNNLQYTDASVSTQGAIVQPSKTAPFAIQSSVTLSQLNALKVLTMMRQRAALSDGSYNELFKAQYNESPDLHVGKPFYVGGTKQPLIFNEVVQTSESSESSPLGRTGSRGVSAGNGYIGRYHSKDFGMLLSVLTIVPDTYYTQGVDKIWTRTTQSEFHFPLMENLAPEPILNKELLFTGVPAVDDDVFAYNERCSEYKSNPNIVCGNLQFSSSVDEEDSAYTMKRNFNSTPQLNYGFTGMFPSNLDYSVFSNSVDAPFIFSITSRCRATLPLSYVTMPNDGLTNVS